VRGLSRREFLGGAAGVAAAIALPSGGTRAAAPRLAGATVSPQAYGVTSYLDAAHIFDGFVGLPMATALEKVYMAPSSFPSKPPAKMTQLAAAGCHFLVSVKPSLTMTPSEQSRLSSWLTRLNNAGFSYRAALFAEANDMGFTRSSWLAYWQFYAPVIKGAGVSCVYNPGCNNSSFPNALAYFPANPAPDELWMDYYATSFRGGTRLEPLIAVAQSAGVPAGLGEWGWSAGPIAFSPMTMPWWNAYCNYLINNLANMGKLQTGGIFFDALGHGDDAGVILTANDPRIPNIQRVAGAL
jgi:hypothetical protein